MLCVGFSRDVVFNADGVEVTVSRKGRGGRGGSTPTTIPLVVTALLHASFDADGNGIMIAGDRQRGSFFHTSYGRCLWRTRSMLASVPTTLGVTVVGDVG